MAKKLVDIKVPQFVFLNIVFEVVVKIPYDTQIKQVIANGKKRTLNVEVSFFYPIDLDEPFLIVFLRI